MAALPAPTLSFTIPSHSDDTLLECRIYHPTCLNPKSLTDLEHWKRKAAIVAHPYATLGGCMDDPVVGLIGTSLLKEGFVLGTFNFRGAGNSEGRTSWQGRGEKDDYISFIAFMIYYLHHLSPPNPLVKPRHEHTQSDSELHDLMPVPSQAVAPPQTPRSSSNFSLHQSKPQPLLLLAGYSYGALITTLLPSIVSSILTPYTMPSKESTYASIRLRACSLAQTQNAAMAAHYSSLQAQEQAQASTQQHQHTRGRSLDPSDFLTNPKRRSMATAVRAGGEENLRRTSHESRRSISLHLDSAAVRKSVDRVRSMASPSRASMGAPSPRRLNSTRSMGSTEKRKVAGHGVTESEGSGSKDECLPAISGVGSDLRVAYLLVSPLQGIVSNLVTLPRFWGSKMKSGSKEHVNDMKFTIDPTLAIFGDSDVFLSVRRLRSWAEGLVGGNRGSEDGENGEGLVGRNKESGGGGNGEGLVGRNRKSGGGGNGGGRKVKEGVLVERKEEGMFRYVEVPGAGHFWHRREDCQVLRDEVGAFVRDIG